MMVDQTNGTGGGAAPAQNTEQVIAGAQPEPGPVLAKDASVEDILKFNPFAKKGTDVAPDGKKAPTIEAGKSVQTQQTPAVLPSGQAPQPSNVTDPSIQAIQAILLASAGGTGEAPVREQPAGGGEDTSFKVNWDVPAELVAALRHEDPVQNQAAVRTLINGVANGVLEMVQQRMGELMGQAIPAMLTQREQITSLNTAFYGRHPHLKNPLLVQTVSKVAQAVAQQRKALGQPIDPYADEFMDAVENYMVSTGLAVRPADHPLNRPGAIVPKPKPAPHFGGAGPGARPSGFEKPEAEDLLAQIGL